MPDVDGDILEGYTCTRGLCESLGRDCVLMDPGTTEPLWKGDTGKRGFPKSKKSCLTEQSPWPAFQSPLSKLSPGVMSKEKPSFFSCFRLPYNSFPGALKAPGTFES